MVDDPNASRKASVEMFCNVNTVNAKRSEGKGRPCLWPAQATHSVAFKGSNSFNKQCRRLKLGSIS